MTMKSDDIAALKEIFATKEDLAQFRDEVNGGFSAVMERMEEVQDQMLRAFAMTEESIRRDFALREELDAVDVRIARLERRLDAPHR
ncbi:MAG: hypothetical protein CMJ58_25700 [Planctomycetaceae bacterium]|nr:hypothetical protein [Planctomycetaceae bacterium]